MLVSRRTRLFGIVISFGLAVLGCTSNDTLFIHLTATPPPTLTATPFQSATRFKVGDKPDFVAVASPMRLLASPNPNDKSGGSDLCFTGTQVTIIAVTRGTDQVVYYRIMCAAAAGWTPESSLTSLKPGKSAVVGAESYLTNDPEPDSTDNRAALEPCRAGTSVGILDLAMNTADKTIYAQVQCGSAVGWLSGDRLTPASERAP